MDRWIRCALLSKGLVYTVSAILFMTGILPAEQEVSNKRENSQVEDTLKVVPGDEPVEHVMSDSLKPVAEARISGMVIAKQSTFWSTVVAVGYLVFLVGLIVWYSVNIGKEHQKQVRGVTGDTTGVSIDSTRR